MTGAKSVFVKEQLRDDNSPHYVGSEKTFLTLSPIALHFIAVGNGVLNPGSR